MRGSLEGGAGDTRGDYTWPGTTAPAPPWTRTGPRLTGPGGQGQDKRRGKNLDSLLWTKYNHSKKNLGQMLMKLNETKCHFKPMWNPMFAIMKFFHI